VGLWAGRKQWIASGENEGAIADLTYNDCFKCQGSVPKKIKMLELKSKYQAGKRRFFGTHHTKLTRKMPEISLRSLAAPSIRHLALQTK
jgi:hypothetical protein